MISQVAPSLYPVPTAVRLPKTKQLLWRGAMRLSTSFIGAVMVALMLWIGAVGHAAEPVQCSPMTDITAVYAEGPSNPGKDTSEGQSLHFHLGCSGHCLAAPVATKTPLWGSPNCAVPASQNTSGLVQTGPPLLLRPPIA